MQMGAMLSPQMQCALRILAAPIIELQNLVSQQLEGNPIWEVEAAVANGVAASAEGISDDWRSELSREISCLFEGQASDCALRLVEMLDECGLLVATPKELASEGGWELALVRQVLEELWCHCDAGLFALDRRHSIRLQLLKLGRSGCLADKLLQHAPEALLQMRWKELRALTGLTTGELQRQLRLDLQEVCFCSLSRGHAAPTLVADAKVELHAGIWRVDILKELWPELTLRREYIDPNLYGSRAEQIFVERHYKEGLFIGRALENRSHTLLRILQVIVPMQSELLVSGHGCAQPISMGMVAKELGLSESTLSRAVAHKWLDAPRGMIPLRSLFAATNAITSASSQISVQQMLTQLISQEPKRSPLSDTQLAERMQGLGFQIARRTVAKYRKLLNIPSQDKRKAQRVKFRA